MAELTPYQRDILIRTALGEARGEGADGMADVVQVIFNRARSPRFPDDPAAVALQDKQFSTWNKGKGGNNPQQFSTNSKAYQTAAQVVDLVASGKAPDMTGGALDYHASNVTPYWADSKKGQYGTIQRNGHTFYPTHPVPPGELPSVASLLSVYRDAPTPVTPSIDLAQMRRTAPPTSLIADSFNALPQRSGSGLGDSLALNPVRADFPGEGQWDGGYSPSRGAVTLNSNPRGVDLPRPRPQTVPSDLISTSMQRSYSTNPVRLPPVPPSTLGQAPSTRVVQSVPVPSRPASRPRVTVSTPSTVPQRMAAQDIGNVPRTVSPAAPRTAFVPEARYIEPRNVAPAQQQYSGPFTPQVRVAQPNGSIIQNKPEDRLPIGVGNNGLDPFGSVAGVVSPPTPRPPIARAPVPAPPYRAVADQIDVQPMPDLPRRRPDLGMGGVDIPGTISQTGQVAPVPMPRLQRPGLFGRPQILGHDIPLPGVFGLIQSATMAMNNASGPFDNGADNSLYNTMRGGDFNARGAATSHAGGYMYAPKQGGGYINVGRQFPGISGADLYDSLNTRNERNDDAGNRVNGRGQYGGAGRSLV